MKHIQSQGEKKYFARFDLEKYFYSARSVPKDDEVKILINFLNKYSKSERYSNVMKLEKDTSLKSLLSIYKKTFFEDILRTEISEYKEMSLEKDISVEDPMVGDLLVAIGHLL